MIARCYICDCCGLVEQEDTGDFHIFRYKVKSSGFFLKERRKMVLCHSCFCKMLDFCSAVSTESLDWQENDND